MRPAPDPFLQGRDNDDTDLLAKWGFKHVKLILRTLGTLARDFSRSRGHVRELVCSHECLHPVPSALDCETGFFVACKVRPADSIDGSFCIPSL
ncbi:protein of unknown function [Methylocaldum szegediense]|uniref:Uncharacterized protein n=1 Tax=Methylocaldum szegediense TaxID=73780 RepID=A0ABN8XCG0_9GAMM|nr:protein of unknown function [Methylocaldum szegediense]